MLGIESSQIAAQLVAIVSTSFMSVYPEAFSSTQVILTTTAHPATRRAFGRCE